MRSPAADYATRVKVAGLVRNGSGQNFSFMFLSIHNKLLAQ